MEVTVLVLLAAGVFLFFKFAYGGFQPGISVGRDKSGAQVWRGYGITLNLDTKVMTVKGRQLSADQVKSLQVERGNQGIALLAINTTDLVKPKIYVRVGSDFKARELKQSLLNAYQNGSDH